MGLHLTVVSFLKVTRASGRNLSGSFFSAKCFAADKGLLIDATDTLEVADVIPL